VILAKEKRFMQEQQEIASKLGWRTGLSVLWFALTAFAFFGSLVGVSVPMGALTASYGLILLTSCATLALALVGQKGKKKHVE
jgi:hypothetical protein